MEHTADTQHEARGLSTSQVIFLFLAGVAVCAVFFSAGFFVGYNERVAKATTPPSSEQVNGAAEIPPVVARESSETVSRSSRTGSQERDASVTVERPAPLRPQPLATAAGRSRASDTKPAVDTRTPSPAATLLSSAAPKVGGGEQTQSRAPARELANDASGNFIIQVAATGTKPDAEKMVRALMSLGYPVTMLTPEQARASDNLYRVHVGPFATRESAEKIRGRLVLDGFKQPFIKH